MIAQFLWGSSNKKTIHWVRWELAARPKEIGGLGFFDLKVRNRSFLNKWIWRFSFEEDSLWRKVVTIKYGYDPKSLIPAQKNPRELSWMWRNIVEPVNDLSDKFVKNLRVVLGDGTKINFWKDLWVGSAPLKQSFPRIYALAIKKEGKVVEFGRKTNARWSWSIELRRGVFNWERNQ
ncbi:hypothetical protein HRI_001707800 [Hibiscus trionum]|uniref:Uncharacterized protein n=1 Tax=Hibiscus trionum TaxID=183268 RepID=A0A9W7HM71_HIBTR|nr:hypothetical protein HRI_001707800 [Hibiscus trionum]